MPRVINVDKNPAYARAVTDLKASGTISRRCRLRQCKYLNNIVEQDHRNVKRRTWLAKGYGSLQTAWRTLRGIEAMEMLRKGRARWVAKDDVVGRAKFREQVVRRRRVVPSFRAVSALRHFSQQNLDASRSSFLHSEQQIQSNLPNRRRMRTRSPGQPLCPQANCRISGCVGDQCPTYLAGPV